MRIGGPGSEPHQGPFAAGVPIKSQIPQGILHQSGAAVFNLGFPVQQYPSVPNFQVGLSDHDNMKIAMQTKQLRSRNWSQRR